jgi:isoleucyl-tRNA synthetase
MIAPIAPFVAEEIYQNLRSSEMPESVHLQNYPELTGAMKKNQDPDLEARMRNAQLVVSLARSIRNEVKLKVRQPLSEMIVASPSKSIRESIDQTAHIIKDEINVKNIITVEKSSEIVSKKAKPQYKQLGPKAGKLMKKVAEIIENLNEETLDHLEKSGQITLDVDGAQIHINREDVEFYEELKKENWVVGREGGILIALNTRITAELENEGIAREFINRIQNLRKEAGFEVTDRITIGYQAPEKIRNAIERLADYIMSETLALQMKPAMDGGDIQREITINGINFMVVLERKDT